MSRAIPPYLPTWELNKEATLEAERQGLDFVLSMMKFRGFGGDTSHWDACLESFTLAGALASITSRIGLIPTATILALHPAYVARMIATLDDVSGGRIGLNIVSGWNRLEYAQMGLWRGDEYYGTRYEYALPYVEILRALWRDGRVTHKSRFFELNDCHCFPRPQHEIPIVSAGQSSAGRRFVAQIGGHSFAMAAPERLPGLADDLRKQAYEYGTRVGTYALFHLIADDTDEKAWATAQKIVAQGDVEAIKCMIELASLDSVKGGTTEQLREAAAVDASLLGGEIEVGNMAFMSFPAIIGSFETVARKIDAIAENGNIEGILFSWPDWVSGIRNFGERVIPLLKCRRGWDVQKMGGLRGAGRPVPISTHSHSKQGVDPELSLTKD
jgi:pyrimidine oxygenase